MPEESKRGGDWGKEGEETVGPHDSMRLCRLKAEFPEDCLAIITVLQ